MTEPLPFPTPEHAPDELTRDELLDRMQSLQDALAALFQESSRTDMLREAIKTLKPAQQRLVQAVYYDGISVKDYTAREGVDPSAITHRLCTVKNKLKKLL